MDVIAEIKRPWTIKWSVGILVVLTVIGNIYNLSKGLMTPISFIGTAIILISLFAIWQRKKWGRNLLFFYSLLFLPLLIWLIGIWMISPEYHWRFSFKYLYALVGVGTFVLSAFMMFMKPSNEWFSEMEGETVKDDSQQLSWHFQLTLIVMSMGLGFVLITMYAMLVNFHTIEKQLMMNASTYYSKLAVLLSFESLDFLVGAMVALFPFALIIGYWKKENIFFMARLITIGAILPVLAFPVGKTFFLFSIFFFSKVLIIGVVVYLGLRFGLRAARYVDTLRVPIEIK
ncbi:hypothetical protein [Sulfuricurvum sp.]|uniref:hypothetical protein n=1 Tax=Sulfuricurvum sp. TaxID=2025608 RepID=UPI002604AA4B|nr:hypothetical protein [Sulfuricurvum sp.]MDD3597672.1 hypothetical protein [Sulfuricurvum sp.]